MLFSGAFAVAVQICSYNLNSCSRVSAVFCQEFKCVVVVKMCACVCVCVRVSVVVSMKMKKERSGVRAAAREGGRAPARKEAEKNVLGDPTSPAFGASPWPCFPSLCPSSLQPVLILDFPSSFSYPAFCSIVFI